LQPEEEAAHAGREILPGSINREGNLDILAGQAEEFTGS
jgi:hypothetical protein